jgi:hypothetical protein
LLDSGREILPSMLKDQVAFSEAKISPDHKIVGWLVDYPNPTAFQYQASPISGDLVLYRDGHILHRFTPDQIIWDWGFRHNGKHIAYSSGPLHGGAAECVLRDADSGKVLARWIVNQGDDASVPEWAVDLRY